MTDTNSTYYERKGEKGDSLFAPEALKEAHQIAIDRIAESMGLPNDDPRVIQLTDMAKGFGEEANRIADARLTKLARIAYEKINPEGNWDAIDIEEQDRYREAVEAVEFEIEESFED